MIAFRQYKARDAKTVTGWVKDKTSLFLWSADRFRDFPLLPEVFDGIYYDKSLMGYIAEDDGNMIGHLFMQDLGDGILKFGLIIVDPDKRGFGYGKKMLISALAFAKEKYCPTKVRLYAFDTNEAAYNCYKSLGFAETGSVIYHELDGQTHCYRQMEIEC